DPFERLAWQVHLTANLDTARGRVGRRCPDSQWNGANGPDVQRDVLGFGAIAPGGASHEEAVLVGEGEAQTVDLELRHVFDRARDAGISESSPDALVEGRKL